MLNIAVLKGDGIGTEVIDQAIRVLDKVKEKYNIEYSLKDGLFGGAAIDETGSPLPKETKDLISRCNAILFGAVGGPKWDNVPPSLRPEKGLLEIRKTLGLYANIRPVKCWPQLLDQSPFKNERIKGVNLIIVRELIGGAYFGLRGKEGEGDNIKAFDTIEYSSPEIKRIARVALELAQKRSCRLTSVDKANVLETSRLWRKVLDEEIKHYPGIALNHLYVDNCAMQLCLNPVQFDVIVTENMFGDILSDQASVLGASLGMLASASIGEGPALYEPAHGSAPDIAGQDKANPLAAILSVAMMLDISFGNPEAAKAVENAVEQVLEQGLRTADIYSPGTILTGTKAMGDAVVKELS